MAGWGALFARFIVLILRWVVGSNKVLVRAGVHCWLRSVKIICHVYAGGACGVSVRAALIKLALADLVSG